ncbi:MAG TPA: trypsin-like peptidase domain-containing protein [Acidimicrobiales bacterium]|nr:trypsin-like peptidase domain-containing protein [Acidimicrobiales bacterium]
MTAATAVPRPYDVEAPLDAYSRVVTAVADRLLPSVASLRVVRRVPGGRVPAGSGSAVVITPDGFLLTSAHVVDGSAGGTASFADGADHEFTVVGTDPLSDLAVVRCTADGLAPAVLGDADRLRVGQLVVAVGNPLGYAGSVSAGVVSGLGRSMAARAGRHTRLVENVVQTDASLHPGNSGGALADASAEVVGVNTALVGPMVGQGLGMAVPVNATTRGIVASLMTEGRVRRAYLGIAGGTRPLPPRAAGVVGRERGLEIVSVVAGSPAAAVGLRPEDIVVELDGVPVEDVGDLQRLMVSARIARPVTVTVVRNGRVETTEVTPEELRT